MREGRTGRGVAITRCPDILAFYDSLNRFFRRGYAFEGEAHPFYELVYVIKGAVGVTAGETIYTLHEGEMILHPPEEFHRIWAELDSEPHVLNLSFYAANMPFYTGRVLRLLPKEREKLLSICETVRAAIKRTDCQELNAQRLRLELVLLDLLGRGGSDERPLRSDPALQFTAVVGLLREHIGESLTAQQIASLSAMSLSSLKKIFSQYAGMGVMRFFTEMKMRHAAILLRSGRRVGEVASLVGFSDPNYFSTVFHRVMMESPGYYRTSNMQAEKQKNIPLEERLAMNFIKVKTYDELSEKAADLIAAQVMEKPNCVLGLATGSSPVGAYRRLAERCRAGELDFSGVTSVNLDEYLGLAGTHDQSYRYFMQTNLFDHINIKTENTYVPNGCAEDAAVEGTEYDARIERLGGIDLQLLGIGLDGHIGFNEPADAFTKETHAVDLHESTITANARFFESEADVPRRAITMGMGSIMNAKKVLLIASGPAKKEILEKSFYGPITPWVPASILQLHPDVTVIYSEEA